MTKILVDSGSDIPQDNADGIIVIPLTVRFDEEEYLDGVTLDHHTFFEKLIESDTLPKTSQVSPFEWSKAINEALKDADDVLIVTISSKLSGTYQSACIAAEEFEGKVFVFDSMNVTMGTRALTDLGLRYIKEGHNAAETLKYLEEEREHIHILALLDTLEYLKKGGRISSAVALAGNLLSLKPVVSAIDGEVRLLGTARGSKKGNNYLVEEVNKIGGINFDKPLWLGYTGLSDVLLQKYIKDSAALWEGKIDTLPIATIGCAIGTHVGPDAIAIAFFE